MQVWKRKGFTRLTLEGSLSKSKRVELVFPVTVNVGFLFVLATVKALVEAAVIERLIRRVGGKGLTCASFDVESTLLSELEDVERS